MTGSTIAHYKVLDKLGEGGMGAVYKAEDTRLNRMVALKFLSAPPAESGQLESRFLHEARAAAALDHPNICGVYEINVADGRLYMAMPLIDGESLEKRIAAGPRPLKEALTVAIQTAEGLEEAHAKGIVHRDIKPGNILLVERDRGRLQVKVLDFGLARLTQATKLTREGAQLGTAAYMSPEQAEGRPVDLRTDVWALGVVLYEMVSGQLPFLAEYEQALFYGILNEDPEPLTALRSGVPMELERIVNKCIAKSPDQRYQSMTDLLVDLNALLDTIGRSAAGPSRVSTVAPPPQEQPTAPARALAPWFWGLAGLPLGALAMWGLWPSGAPAELAQPEYSFERVTWDGQLNGWPALSPDGTLLAFASDRGGRGDLDIWVKQVKGGSLVRVTDNPEDELLPSFSPDGSQLVYYRWGKGAYTVPTLGGEPYLVAGGAGAPSWAPDGKSVAYVKENALYVSPVSMGEPRKILDGVTNSSVMQWTRDGKHVLFAGQLADGRIDWWAAPVDGSEVRSLGARELFAGFGVGSFIPESLSALGNSLIYEVDEGDLQSIELDADALRVTGRPVQLTVGAGLEIQPSGSRQGAIAFMDAWQRRDIWSLPLSGGEPERWTASDSSETAGDVLPDGRRLVYTTNRWGSRDIATLNLETRQESILTNDDAEQMNPVISRDGERVAYLARENDKDAIYVRPYGGGVGRLVCADCGTPTDWSPDGRSLLFDRANPPAVAVVEVETGKATDLLAAERCKASLARYAPNGKALAFALSCDGGEAGLYVAPLGDLSPVSRESWIEVTDDHRDSYPAWSPAGDRIYFASRRLGSLDIWMVRLDPATLKPLAAPEVVRRFPFARYSMDLMSDRDRRLSIAGDRIFFALSEAGGAVWLMTPKATESPTK